jgi:signal transduction histidine kinase
MMHKLVERQIKRFLGDVDLQKLPSDLVALLGAISDTYTHADEDRELSLRSLELSSSELVDANQKLHSQNRIVEQKVKERTAELELEKIKLNEIAQNMATGAILLDTHGDVMFINTACERILGSGLKSAELIEKFCTVFDSVSAREHLAQCIEGKSSAANEAEYNGRIFNILFRCLSSEDSIAGHLVWIDDVTDARLLDRSKSEFVAIASHEMRTPLAIIRGQADLLQNSPSVTANSEATRRVSSILKSTVRLLGIVNDFLDVTQLEARRMVFMHEEFDLMPLLEEGISDFQKLASQKNLSLAFAGLSVPLPSVVADKDRVRQIIVGLVGNALHYTEKGGIEVSVSPGPTHVKVLVKDTGLGIDPAKQHLLFQKFQITSEVFMHSREYGSGMGLYIAKMLLEHMGGEIRLEESALGKGSTFSFTIPRAMPGVA